MKKTGHIHPITQLKREIVSIFSKMGFGVVEGNELESSYYNFDSLNIPKDHPARDMWDTFFLEKDIDGLDLLRTHTSASQVRYMEKNKPPMRIVSPGKTFRNEATDATHEAQFHQIEGLCIGENITLANLHSVLKEFLVKFLGEDIDIRIRPGYFPFVEPGIEVDISCVKCSGKGCSFCKETGWIEVLGAGMVHPKVLEYGGIDSNKYQGFAFGVGLDRVVMLKYGIDDIRLFYKGDLRFLTQF